MCLFFNLFFAVVTAAKNGCPPKDECQLLISLSLLLSSLERAGNAHFRAGSLRTSVSSL